MKYNLYNFNKTIYDGNLEIDIILYAGWKYPKIIPSMFLYSLLYFFKLIDKKELKSRMYSFVKYINDIDKFVLDFWNKYEYKIKSLWKNKKNHNNDIILSESGFFLLKYIKNKYRVLDLIATDIDIKTGKIIGNICYKEEKVKKFYEKYPDAIIDKTYTNSYFDLPLIKLAKESYIVKEEKIINYYDYKCSKIEKIINFIFNIYNNREIFCYLVSGFLTVVVSLLSKYLLLSYILNKNNEMELQLSVIISWIIAVTFAYLINRFYVFNSKNKKIFNEIVKFFTSRIATLLLEMILTWLLITKLDFDIVIMTVLIQIIIIVSNYIFSKIFVFRK